MSGPLPGQVAGDMYLDVNGQWWPIPHPQVNHAGWAVATILFLPLAWGWYGAINSARRRTLIPVPCGKPGHFYVIAPSSDGRYWLVPGCDCHRQGQEGTSR